MVKPAHSHKKGMHQICGVHPFYSQANNFFLARQSFLNYQHVDNPFHGQFSHSNMVPLPQDALELLLTPLNVLLSGHAS